MAMFTWSMDPICVCPEGSHCDFFTGKCAINKPGELVPCDSDLKCAQGLKCVHISDTSAVCLEALPGEGAVCNADADCKAHSGRLLCSKNACARFRAEGDKCLYPNNIGNCAPWLVCADSLSQKIGWQEHFGDEQDIC
eukprot:m51a1_g10431 hypothetical protein (138) ;mRNA; r:43402-43952